MPATLIEAGLCGVPSISTPVDGIPEIVVDDETGILVPIGDGEGLHDALHRLQHDAELRRRMGEAALDSLSPPVFSRRRGRPVGRSDRSGHGPT